MPHLLALFGVLIISFSAVFVRLAAVSPVTATFFRALYALPVLSAAWLFQRSRDARTRRERWLALASGLVLAVDLDLWHESIALLGAGLSTVVANVQVVFVAAAAWLLYGERLSAVRASLIGIVLIGVALSSGLGRPDAYGARPVLGAALAVLGGLAYAAFLLIYRRANRPTGSSVGPLLDSTIGTALGAIASVPFDLRFALVPPRTAQPWLALLAVGPQAMGWLLIGAALPRLPAVETSVLLVGQPIVTLIWGVLIFGERLSVVQWLGSAIVLTGVAALSAMRREARLKPDATTAPAEHERRDRRRESRTPRATT